MLQTLHDQGDLHFNFERRKWHFKIPDGDNLPSNVIDLIVRNLKKLPAETQCVIKLAACIGSNEFELWFMSIVYRHSREETAKALWPALEAGFVVPTSNAYQIPLAFEAGSDLSQQWVNTTNTFEREYLTVSTEEMSDSASSSANKGKGKNVVVTYRAFP